MSSTTATVTPDMKQITIPRIIIAALLVGTLFGVGQSFRLPDIPDSITSMGQPALESGTGTGTGVTDTLALLETLEVKGRAPMTGYDRALFGPAWSDDVRVPGGHNGCDTRNDILQRDLEDVVIRPGTHGCLVESGTLTDPYSGKVIHFVRGRGSNDVHIDHVVALGDAWAKGAQSWDEQTRRDFANDPANLLAVDGPLNMQKGAGDAATWLPPAKEFRCTFATIHVEVKASYGLWVTAAEKEALARELSRCP